MTSGESQELWAELSELRPAMMRLALARTGNYADAEDCVHEAFARAMSYDNLDRERLTAFVTTVVTRLAVDCHRRSARELRMQARISALASCERTTEELICDREEGAWAARTLQHLTPRERGILTAVADGHSLRELAGQHGFSYKATESLLGRARAKARSALRPGLAALLPFAWLRTRFGKAPVRTAALPVTAAALAATLAIASGSATHVGQPSIIDSAQPVHTRTIAPASHSGALHATKPQQRGVHQTVVTGTAQLGAPSASHDVWVPPDVKVPGAHHGKLRVGPTSTSTEHKDEGLVASTKRCLRNGIALGPEYYLCDGRK